MRARPGGVFTCRCGANARMFSATGNIILNYHLQLPLLLFIDMLIACSAFALHAHQHVNNSAITLLHA